MKAVVLQRRGKDGVALLDRPEPERKPGWALVKMKAASLNRVDLYMRDNGAGITHDLPLVMGVDGVGEIAAVGPESAFRVGQRVILYPYAFCGTCAHCRAGDQPLCTGARIFGEHIDGTFAEIVAAPEASLFPLSDDVDPRQAATIGVAYLTAWRMVFGKGGAGPGKTALVVGAGGGVSAAAVQLAKLAGCRVIATTSTEEKQAHARRIGADAVIDYRAGNVVKAVMALTDGAGADLVIDNVGAATWEQSLRAVRRGGRVVTCGATTGSHPSADLQRLFIRQISVHGSTMGDLSEFSRLLAAFSRALFTPVIDSVYPLTEAAAAFERLEHPQRFGKVVLDIG